jgi:AcrR family transcriptional regulator
MRRAIDLRVKRGDETHEKILEHGVDLASSEGLDGLTIGRLADAVGVSKAGLFAHFGSKEALQLAIVDRARTVYANRIVVPALSVAEGLPRLRALCEAWLENVEHDTFSGGCFFSAAAAEFDSRPGKVKDRIVGAMREWLGFLESAIKDAQRLGHARPAVDAAQLAFELNALELGSNWAKQLLGDAEATSRARRAILAHIDAIATDAGRAALDSPAPARNPERREAEEPVERQRR